MPAHEPSKFPGNYFPDMNELTPSDNASRSAVLRFQDRLLNNIPDDIDFCLLAGEQFYKPRKHASGPLSSSPRKQASGRW